MDSAYEPPRDDWEMHRAVHSLPWVGYMRGTLMVCGAAYALLALSFAPMGYFVAMADPEVPEEAAAVMAVIYGVMGLVCCGGFAAANFAAAAGLAQGKKWAWITAVVLGGMYVTSVCLPFGAVLLIGAFQDPVRRMYLDGELPEAR